MNYDENRKCSVEGCENLGQHTGNYRIDGTIIRRDKCHKHHSMEYGINGWEYKIFRKDYCENIDGRLGYFCTTTIINPELQLDCDHINGDHSDNREENIQTLCKCCHAIKTHMYRDYLPKKKKKKKSKEKITDQIKLEFQEQQFTLEL